MEFNTIVKLLNANNNYLGSACGRDDALCRKHEARDAGAMRLSMPKAYQLTTCSIPYPIFRIRKVVLRRLSLRISTNRGWGWW